MLKLNASYSKKVPAEGEYTSQSYHASIEVELPDGLSAEQLNGKIHETFALVRNSVEAELHGAAPAVTVTTTPENPSKKQILGVVSQKMRQHLSVISFCFTIISLVYPTASSFLGAHPVKHTMTAGTANKMTSVFSIFSS